MTPISRAIATQFKAIRFLLASGSSTYVTMRYVSYGISALFNDYKTMFNDSWYGSGYSRHWPGLFPKYNVHAKRILEIGSFRGVAARFLIDYFQDAQLTCVDTWAGSPDLAGIDFNDIEEDFDRFKQKYPSRVQKIKSTSNSFFSNQDAKFDLIYVDASHFADDVVVDLINSWAVLEIGGIMICDDYIWQHYSRVRDNPCAAVNSFLMLKSGQYRLLAVYRQIWIKKLV
jgi:SAM-dependent methyltransferase